MVNNFKENVYGEVFAVFLVFKLLMLLDYLNTNLNLVITLLDAFLQKYKVVLGF